MLGGIKNLPSGNYCMYCNAKMNSEKFNFCPNCGNPLTDNAIRLREQQDKKVKLEVLANLTEKIDDEKMLKILSDFIKES